MQVVAHGCSGACISIEHCQGEGRQTERPVQQVMALDMSAVMRA